MMIMMIIIIIIIILSRSYQCNTSTSRRRHRGMVHREVGPGRGGGEDGDDGTDGSELRWFSASGVKLLTPIPSSTYIYNSGIRAY